MKKIIIFIIVFATTINIFGCAKNQELSDELLEEINAAYQEKHNEDFRFTTYYGKFGRAEAFYRVGTNLIVTTIYIEGIEFTGGSNWTIVLYAKGKFYNLETDYQELLNRKILTISNLSKMAKIHNENAWH